MPVPVTRQIVFGTLLYATVAGGLFLLVPTLWTLGAFAASPLVMLTLVSRSRSRLAADERRAPAVRFLKADLQRLVGEWNQTNQALAVLEADWEWRPGAASDMDDLADALAPFVSRTGRGLLRVREKATPVVSAMRLAEANRTWHAIRESLLAEAKIELETQTLWAEEALERMRKTRLVQAGRVTHTAPPGTWPEALEAIDRLRDDIHLAVEEAVQTSMETQGGAHAADDPRHWDTLEALKHERLRDAVVSLGVFHETVASG